LNLSGVVLSDMTADEEESHSDNVTRRESQVSSSSSLAERTSYDIAISNGIGCLDDSCGTDPRGAGISGKRRTSAEIRRAGRNKRNSRGVPSRLGSISETVMEVDEETQEMFERMSVRYRRSRQENPPEPLGEEEEEEEEVVEGEARASVAGVQGQEEKKQKVNAPSFPPPPKWQFHQGQTNGSPRSEGPPSSAGRPLSQVQLQVQQMQQAQQALQMQQAQQAPRLSADKPAKRAAPVAPSAAARRASVMSTASSHFYEQVPTLLKCGMDESEVDATPFGFGRADSSSGGSGNGNANSRADGGPVGGRGSGGGSVAALAATAALAAAGRKNSSSGVCADARANGEYMMTLDGNSQTGSLTEDGLPQQRNNGGQSVTMLSSAYAQPDDALVAEVRGRTPSPSRIDAASGGGGLAKFSSNSNSNSSSSFQAPLQPPRVRMVDEKIYEENFRVSPRTSADASSSPADRKPPSSSSPSSSGGPQPEYMRADELKRDAAALKAARGRAGVNLEYEPAEVVEQRVAALREQRARQQDKPEPLYVPVVTNQAYEQPVHTKLYDVIECTRPANPATPQQQQQKQQKQQKQQRKSGATGSSGDVGAANSSGGGDHFVNERGDIIFF
jgi:hypothetical protein